MSIPLSELPPQGRLIGIDFGQRRVGIAICDPTQTIASPLDVYTRESEIADAKYFRQLAEQEQPVGFVVGLPLHVSGDESEMSVAARSFGKWLSDLTGIPVTFYDEP